MSIASLRRPSTFEHPPEYEPLSREKVREFCQHHSEVMEFLAHEGNELLNRKESLTHEEWKILLEWTLNAWFGLASRFTRRLLELVIERGIKDLGHLVNTSEANSEELWRDCRMRGPLVGNWAIEILSSLDPARIKEDRVRLQLIKEFSEVLVTLSRKIGRPVFLDNIAQRRHLGDYETSMMWYRDLCTRAGLEPDKH